MNDVRWVLFVSLAVLTVPGTCVSGADSLAVVQVEGQPLSANVARVLQALEFLGAPWPENKLAGLQSALRANDAPAVQRLLDPEVLFEVSINPESRVKVRRGPAAATLQQAGYTPVLVKIVNASTVTKRLRVVSPQSGPVYAGVAELSMKRQQQEELRANENKDRRPDRFLAVEMFEAPPMTDRLSGLAVEYAIALIHSSESGKREATIGFDVGVRDSTGNSGAVGDSGPGRPAHGRKAYVSRFHGTCLPAAAEASGP
jgi:hypothetical protein